MIDVARHKVMSGGRVLGRKCRSLKPGSSSCVYVCPVEWTARRHSSASAVEYCMNQVR